MPRHRCLQAVLVVYLNIVISTVAVKSASPLTEMLFEDSSSHNISSERDFVVFELLGWCLKGVDKGHVT